MVGAASNIRKASSVLILVVTLGWWTPGVSAQATASDQMASAQPLPDIDVGGLMHEVEARQKAAEAIEKDYLYHAVDTVEQLDRQGKVKKTQTKEYDVFWMEGVPVRKLTRKDGRALSADEQRKESERIDKAVKKAMEKRAKAEAKGKVTDPNGDEEVTVSRLLELGSFGNARRVTLDGRRTIAVDFTGDPKAETRNRMEAVIRDTAGTVWVDEQDRALARVEGHFLKSFKIGAGLVVNIEKGTSFSMVQRKVNGEVWLPERIEGRGAARAFLLFSFRGNFREIDSDYRKFKVTTTILPGMGKVEEEK